MHLAAAADNRVAHRLDDLRQAVGADVRMGVGQDVGRGAVLTEHAQDLVRVAAFLRAGIELAVGVGPCPTLAEAVVALGVDQLRARDLRQVLLALVHVLATLQHDGPETQLDQAQSRKQAARAGPDDDDLRTVADVVIVDGLEDIVLRLLADIDAYFQVDKDGALAGVDGALQDAHALDLPVGYALLVGNKAAQAVSIGCHLRQDAKLVFCNHI